MMLEEFPVTAEMLRKIASTARQRIRLRHVIRAHALDLHGERHSVVARPRMQLALSPPATGCPEGSRLACSDGAQPMARLGPPARKVK